MKHYKFNKSLLDLEGKPLSDGGKEINIAKALASHLVQQSKGDAIKLYDWARTLHTVGDLELDRSDSRKLKQIIDGMDNITVLFKAQLFEILDTAEVGDDATQ